MKYAVEIEKSKIHVVYIEAHSKEDAEREALKRLESAPERYQYDSYENITTHEASETDEFVKRCEEVSE